jgi:hypothetical protein
LTCFWKKNSPNIYQIDSWGQACVKLSTKWPKNFTTSRRTTQTLCFMKIDL